MLYEVITIGAFFSKASELPKEINDFFVQFPVDLKAIVDKMKEGRFKIEFEHVGLEAMEESIEKSANRLSIAILIAAILVGSALLLLAKTPPLFLGIPLLRITSYNVCYTKLLRRLDTLWHDERCPASESILGIGRPPKTPAVRRMPP